MPDLPLGHRYPSEFDYFGLAARLPQHWTTMMLHRFVVAAWLLALAVSPVCSAEALPSSNRETPLVRAIRKVRPSVVSIHSKKTAPISNVAGHYAGPENRMNGMGTGVIVDARGYVVTNYHVIEDTSEIRVTLVDGASYYAEVVGRDPQTDLALLKIAPRTPLAVMPMGTSDQLWLGESVVAIGNAYGYEHTVTRGIISELHREVRLSTSQVYHDLIQTDASINPGNSGGPLVNVDGEMIGLNVAIRAGAQGIGFAIPVNQVRQVVTRLLAAAEPTVRWQGLVLRTTVEGQTGRLVVDSIASGSAAETARFQQGDRLLSIAGRTIRSPRDLELVDGPVGSTGSLEVRILRNGREHVLSLGKNDGATTNSATAAANANPARGHSAGNGDDLIWRRLGLRLLGGSVVSDVSKISSRLKGGLQVAAVAAQGPAKDAGIAPGDILVGLGHGPSDWETVSLENVVYVLERHAQGTEHLLRFYIVRSNKIWRGHVTLKPIERPEPANP
jgi:serine protease Do